jgi:hypothetical protein
MPAPALRFSPTAWAKLLFLRDAGESEVGGFGISAKNDLLYLEDVRLVRQVCDVASVILDDSSLADFIDGQVDAGVAPSHCGRIWVHTHPGASPQPSQVDEETFRRAFAQTEWAIMFVLARGGRTYARLRFHVGSGGDIDLPVDVDWSKPFAGSDHSSWLAEYQANVTVCDAFGVNSSGKATDAQPWDDDWFTDRERCAEENALLQMEDRGYGF